MTQVTLPGDAVLRLIHAFLCEAGLYATARSLEVEGLADPGVCTSPSAALLRALCLDGQFTELASSLQDAAPPAVLWALKRQEFLEAFDAVADADAAPTASGGSSSPTAEKVHRAGDNASRGQLLAALLAEAREVAPSRRDFNSLCYVLSLPAVNAHPEFSWWTPHAGRLRVWQAVAQAFDVPVNASDVPPGQLPRLLAHAGGLYLLAATGAAAGGGALPRRITFDPTRPVPLVAPGGESAPGTPSSRLLVPPSPASRPGTQEGHLRSADAAAALRAVQAVLGAGGPHATQVDMVHMTRRGVVVTSEEGEASSASRPSTSSTGPGIGAVHVTAPLSGPVPLLAGRVSTLAPALLTPLGPSEVGFGSPSRGAAAVAALNRSFVVGNSSGSAGAAASGRRDVEALVSPPARAPVSRRFETSPSTGARPDSNRVAAGRGAEADSVLAAASPASPSRRSAQASPQVLQLASQQEEQDEETQGHGVEEEDAAPQPLKVVYVPAGEEDDEEEEEAGGADEQLAEEDEEEEEEQDERAQLPAAERDEQEEGDEATGYGPGPDYLQAGDDDEEEEEEEAEDDDEDVVAAVRHLSFANVTAAPGGGYGHAEEEQTTEGEDEEDAPHPASPSRAAAFEWPSQISLRESEAGIAALLAEAGLQRPLTATQGSPRRAVLEAPSHVDEDEEDDEDAEAAGYAGLAASGGHVVPPPEVARPPLLASPARAQPSAPPLPPSTRSPARSPAPQPSPGPFSPRSLQATAPPRVDASPAAAALSPASPRHLPVPVWEDASVTPTAVWCEAGNQPVRVAAPLHFDPMLPPLVLGGTNAKALHLFACEDGEAVVPLATAPGVHAGSVYCADTLPEASDSVLVATGSNDTMVKVTRIDTGGLLTAGLAGGAGLTPAITFPGEVGTIRAVKWLQLPMPPAPAEDPSTAPLRFWLGLVVAGGHPTRRDYCLRVFEVGAVDVTPEGEAVATLAARARRVALLRGHTDVVNAVVVLRGLREDDVTLVTGSADGTCKAWTGLARVLRREAAASAAPLELAPALSLPADEEGGPVHALVPLPPHALPAPTTLATLVCAVGTGLLTALTLTTDPSGTALSGMAQRLSTASHFHTQEARGLDVVALAPHEWVLASVSFDGTLCLLQITELSGEGSEDEEDSSGGGDIPTLIATLLVRAGSAEALRRAAALPGMVPSLRTHTTTPAGGHTDKVLSAAWLPAGTHLARDRGSLRARLVTSGGEGRLVWWDLSVPLDAPIPARSQGRLPPGLPSPAGKVLVL